MGVDPRRGVATIGVWPLAAAFRAVLGVSTSLDFFFGVAFLGLAFAGVAFLGVASGVAVVLEGVCFGVAFAGVAFAGVALAGVAFT